MNAKSCYPTLLLMICFLPYGCEHKRDMSKLPKLSARDQTINAAQRWDIQNKEGERIAQIKNVPGNITGDLPPPPGTPITTHPFIDISYYGVLQRNDGSSTNELLARAHNFDEFLSLLHEKGYKVIPNPYDKKPFWKVSGYWMLAGFLIFVGFLIYRSNIRRDNSSK